MAKNLRARSSTILLCLALTGVAVSAQNITGTITGTITDPNKALSPNVRVDIRNEGTGLTRTVTTDSHHSHFQQGSDLRARFHGGCIPHQGDVRAG